MNAEPKTLSLIVYDFDGTLVDTLADIADSVNLALKELNLRSLSREIIRAYVGGGMHRLMEQALNGTGYDDIKHAVTLFRKHYGDHLLDQTEFYPNTRETVEHFSNKKNAIFSNKPAAFIERILNALDFRHPFHAVLGGDSLDTRKPDPSGLHLLMRQFNCSPEQVLMVGDSAIDIETGKRAGAWTCGVSYGLGNSQALQESQPHYMIDDLSRLKALLK